MKNQIIILTFVILFLSCTYEKGGITDDNLDYKKIEIVRLKLIKKGLNFK